MNLLQYLSAQQQATVLRLCFFLYCSSSHPPAEIREYASYGNIASDFAAKGRSTTWRDCVAKGKRDLMLSAAFYDGSSYVIAIIHFLALHPSAWDYHTMLPASHSAAVQERVLKAFKQAYVVQRNEVNLKCFRLLLDLVVREFIKSS